MAIDPKTTGTALGRATQAYTEVLTAPYAYRPLAGTKLTRIGHENKLDPDQIVQVGARSLVESGRVGSYDYENLVAWIAAATGKSPTQIKEAVQEQLADYEVADRQTVLRELHEGIEQPETRPVWFLGRLQDGRHIAVDAAREMGRDDFYDQFRVLVEENGQWAELPTDCVETNHGSATIRLKNGDGYYFDGAIMNAQSCAIIGGQRQDFERLHEKGHDELISNIPQIPEPEPFSPKTLDAASAQALAEKMAAGFGIGPDQIAAVHWYGQATEKGVIDYNMTSDVPGKGYSNMEFTMAGRDEGLTVEIPEGKYLVYLAYRTDAQFPYEVTLQGRGMGTLWDGSGKGGAIARLSASGEFKQGRGLPTLRRQADRLPLQTS